MTPPQLPAGTVNISPHLLLTVHLFCFSSLFLKARFPPAWTACNSALWDFTGIRFTWQFSGLARPTAALGILRRIVHTGHQASIQRNPSSCCTVCAGFHQFIHGRYSPQAPPALFIRRRAGKRQCNGQPFIRQFPHLGTMPQVETVILVLVDMEAAPPWESGMKCGVISKIVHRLPGSHNHHIETLSGQPGNRINLVQHFRRAEDCAPSRPEWRRELPWVPPSCSSTWEEIHGIAMLILSIHSFSTIVATEGQTKLFSPVQPGFLISTGVRAHM